MKNPKTQDDYINGSAEPVAALLRELRHFIHAELPGVAEGMQYGGPVFFNSKGVPVIYLFGSKAHVNFGFLQSEKLKDPDQLLKGSGKPSKHVKLRPGEPIDSDMLRGFISQCSDIDATV